MVVISNLLDSMCSCISDQACGGGVPRHDFAPPSFSEDVQMADDSPANSSPTTDGRQSSSGSPTGSTHSNRSSNSRASPSPSHFLKFRGAHGTDWHSLVRRTSCGAAGAGADSSSTSRPSSPSIQDSSNNSTVMRCLDMDNAQMALAHARQQVGARAQTNHHKRKASSDIFRSRHRTSASAESSSSSDEPKQQDVRSSERVASPAPLGGLCAPNLNGNGPMGVRSLLRFPGLCFANPIRGSSSFDDQHNVHEQSSSTFDDNEADRPASPAYLLEQELADPQRRPGRPMPLYASQQVVPTADAGIDDGPICLTDMIRQANGNGGDGAKKMRLTAPSAPVADADAKPSFAFSSSSDEEEEEEDASVESTPATITEGAEGEAPITPTAPDAIGTSTTANTNTASPPSTNVQSASSAPTHQITPNFTPSTSRPHKQQRMKSPGTALNANGGIQVLGSGPSVPELLFAGGHHPEGEAPVTPGQVVPMSAPPGHATANVPVTPEKPYFDV